mmetsp:Transcript_118683/g.165371  ORF Transcript_118683/g.165371 Transcript_118683/m.165371 type:complete len:193 (+) Transcript_118683:160-738(+)
MFFDHLRDMGHEVTFEMAVDPGAIRHYEDYFYDNIVFMAPSVKESDFGDDVNTQNILEFVSDHHNLMIFADNDARAPVRKLANNFGMDFEAPGYEMHDYEQAVNHDNDHIISTKNIFEPLQKENPHLFGSFDNTDSGVFFQGIGGLIDPNNKFVFPILRAEPTSFSMSRKDTSDISNLSGEQITLVAGYQTR